MHHGKRKAFQLGAEIFRFQNDRLTLLGQEKREQNFFGNSRDFHGVVVMDDLAAVQWMRGERVAQMVGDFKFDIGDFFKPQKIIDGDGTDDFFIGLKIRLQQFSRPDPVNGKRSDFVFQVTEHLAVPRVVIKHQRVRFENPLGGFVQRRGICSIFFG